MKEYRLCYIDGHKAWFTDSFENQWGDDFDDAPYECNAEEPYDSWSELIEDNEDMFKRKYIHHPIEHKVLYFDPGIKWDYCYLPCDRGMFSVEQINKGITPWIWSEDFKIDAGTTYEDFIKIVEENGGTIYERRK